MRFWLLASIFVTMTIAGCTEATTIRTFPTNAQVWVNDKYVGITPVRYIIPRSEWPVDGRFHYRAEREGCVPKEGDFHSVVAAGRITGAVFTLGTLLIFKRPTTLPDTYDIVLDPVATTTGRIRPTSPSVEERLRQVDDLYEHGAITEQERLRKRREILDNL